MRKIFVLAVLAPLLALLAGGDTVSGHDCLDIPDTHEGKPSILVELSAQQAYLYEGGELVASSRISTGREGYDTPTGRFRVIKKDRDHRSSVYGYYADEDGNCVMDNIDKRKDKMPPGCQFIGASMPFFLEFLPGYGLHAGYLPGFPASHGCVRMPYWKARAVFQYGRGRNEDRGEAVGAAIRARRGSAFRIA